jgi:hypothetical protein
VCNRLICDKGVCAVKTGNGEACNNPGEVREGRPGAEVLHPEEDWHRGPSRTRELRCGLVQEKVRAGGCQIPTPTAGATTPGYCGPRKEVPLAGLGTESCKAIGGS